MSTPLFAPPLTAPDQLDAALRRQGHAVLGAASVQALSGCSAADLQALTPYWDDLPPDNWLKDGGHYRRRRHACFVLDGETLEQAPHRAHWQPVEYNALHGGLQRLFEPMDGTMAALPAWGRLLRWLGRVTSELKGAQPWYIEAHPFRIDTTDGIGRPTPEGAHRDGVDLVAVFLVQRRGVKGGETRVFATDGPQGQRFTLVEPWSLLLLDDARVIHETTPIQPSATSPDAPAHRDTLVLTLRAKAFQGEGEA
jgi:hypothetical protein